MGIPRDNATKARERVHLLTSPARVATASTLAHVVPRRGGSWASGTIAAFAGGALLLSPVAALAATVAPSLGVVQTGVIYSSSSLSLSGGPTHDIFTSGGLRDLSTSVEDSISNAGNSIDYRSSVQADWTDAKSGAVTWDSSFAATFAGSGGKAGAGGSWAYTFTIDGADTITLDYITAGTGAYAAAPDFELLVADDTTWDDLYRVVVSGTGSLTVSLPGAGRYQILALNSGNAHAVNFASPGAYSGGQTASLNWHIGPNPSSAAPEPSAWALMVLGFCGAGVALRRVRSRAFA